jgi:di/tricarboxylate transporter
VTTDIVLVLVILAVALVLFISEVIRMDLVALLVLCALSIFRLVTPNEAISGFSNAAVVTVWAMFILSDGLTRTGIANILGRRVLAIAGRREIPLIFWIMVISGGLSAFMNNIGVAALMLPVVVDIARRAEIPPSRLLMPLAFGCLLGGLTTLIGTPPNLLISGALVQNGLQPFGFFDFTPVGLGAMLAGTLFMALVGRLMLPRTDPASQTQKHSQRNMRAQYGLQERTFAMTVPFDSVLVGKTLAASRISSAAGLIVMALERRQSVMTLPSRQTVLKGGDKLVIQGRLDRFNEMRQWSDLVIEREAPLIQALLSGQIQLVEVTVAEGSTLVKGLLHHTEFRRRFGANVLAIRRDELVRRVNLAYVPIRAGDRLLLQGSDNIVNDLEASQEFSEIRIATEEDLIANYRWRLFGKVRCNLCPNPMKSSLVAIYCFCKGVPRTSMSWLACRSLALPKNCRPTLISLNPIALARSRQRSRRNLLWPGRRCRTSIFMTSMAWNWWLSGDRVKQFGPTWIDW